ncbi:uncharacterized protein N7515_000887 [Penicillium bovifimosum]|uniref:Lysine-specific metallo-endopeptidase domain-containing protein n=1 Tax=Penicillium bovifimosum TaxID=126998 RepID=A0A9W9HGM9_9EURO|nr:uncharacterized protein N7515_000887 [Penicillium bovifimosum]KAJ5146323.1 hypothetical protein N7515_000887 [Penicillium bovifimosum]
MKIVLILLEIIGLLSNQAWSQDVYKRFHVEQGSGPITRTGNLGGSCDGVDVEKGFDIAKVYREAIDMASVALKALDNYDSDATVRSNLFTWFGIEENVATHTVAASSVDRFNTVQENYAELVEQSEQEDDGAEARIFCSEKWRWKTRWVYNEETGEKTGQLLKVNPNFDSEWDYWSPRFKSYSGDRVMCGPTTFGFTSFEERSSITFCPLSFQWASRKHSLSEWRSGERTIPQGKNMQFMVSTPGILLHELMHMWSGAEDQSFIDPHDQKSKKAYGAVLTGELASVDPDKAADNADNFMWFAIASYLSQYDWSRVVSASRTRVAGTTSRSVFRKRTHRRHNSHHSHHFANIEAWGDDM